MSSVAQNNGFYKTLCFAYLRFQRSCAVTRLAADNAVLCWLTIWQLHAKRARAYRQRCRMYVCRYCILIRQRVPCACSTYLLTSFHSCLQCAHNTFCCILTDWVHSPLELCRLSYLPLSIRVSFILCLCTSVRPCQEATTWLSLFPVIRTWLKLPKILCLKSSRPLISMACRHVELNGCRGGDALK